MGTLTSCTTALRSHSLGSSQRREHECHLNAEGNPKEANSSEPVRKITFLLLVIKSLLKGELSPTSPCPPSSTPCATQFYVSMIYGDRSSWALMDLISWRETRVEGGLCNKTELPSLQLTQDHNWYPLSPSSLFHSKFPSPSATTKIDLASFPKEPSSV